MIGLELAARDGGEQVVEPEPVTLLVERDQEEVAAFELVEDGGRASGLSDEVAQRCRESVEERHRDDELPDLVRVLTQHLLREVVPDEAVAPAEPAHGIVGIGIPGEPQSSQVDAGRPSLGALDQPGDAIAREWHLLQRHHLGGLEVVEAEVVRANLREASGRPEPAEPESGVRPGDDHEVRTRGEVLDEELDLAVAFLVGDEVEVVEQDEDVVLDGCQRVHDRGQHSLAQAVDVGRHEEIDGGRVNGAADPFERRPYVRPESPGVVVAGVQRDPSRPPLRCPSSQPLGHQRGLAVARRSGDQHDRPLARVVQLHLQPRPVDPVLPEQWAMELRLEERVDRPARRLGSVGVCDFALDHPRIPLPHGLARAHALACRRGPGRMTSG